MWSRKHPPLHSNWKSANLVESRPELGQVRGQPRWMTRLTKEQMQSAARSSHANNDITEQPQATTQHTHH